MIRLNCGCEVDAQDIWMLDREYFCEECLIKELAPISGKEFIKACDGECIEEEGDLEAMSAVNCDEIIEWYGLDFVATLFGYERVSCEEAVKYISEQEYATVCDFCAYDD